MSSPRSDRDVIAETISIVFCFQSFLNARFCRKTSPDRRAKVTRRPRETLPAVFNRSILRLRLRIEMGLSTGWLALIKGMCGATWFVSAILSSVSSFEAASSRLRPTRADDAWPACNSCGGVLVVSLLTFSCVNLLIFSWFSFVQSTLYHQSHTPDFSLKTVPLAHKKLGTHKDKQQKVSFGSIVCEFN